MYGILYIIIPMLNQNVCIELARVYYCDLSETNLKNQNQPKSCESRTILVTARFASLYIIIMSTCVEGRRPRAGKEQIKIE